MDPNIRRISWVARKCMLFGFAFIAVGLLLLVLLPTSPQAPAGIAIVAGALVFLGAILMCVRVGVVLDRQHRVITIWWGPLFPLYKTEHSLSPADFLAISREERNAFRQTYEVFPVRLVGAGSDAITVHEPLDHDKARHLAEDVAKFLHLGIRDRSSGQEVAREAGALDQSLRQRLRRAGRRTPLPVQPPHARSVFSYGGARAPTTIDIPPAGRSGRWFLLVLCIAGFVALFTELFVAGADMEIGVWTLLVFLIVLGFFLPLLLRTAILRERLIVSPEDLVVTRRDIFGTQTTRLTCGEIEEVEVVQANYGISARYATFDGGTGRVAIRSDRASIELGAALSNPDEVRWLSDVVVHVLSLDSRAAR